MTEKILIGISSCLLGDNVRYDGGHKKNNYVNSVLSEYFDFVPVCPEVGIGMGVPRPPIRLVEMKQGVRAVGRKDPSVDVTEPLTKYIDKAAPNLKQICGYILKSGSPSCGMERVKIYSEEGPIAGTGSGLYAAKLMERFPELPLEEEGRLNDPGLRENFITRIFVYYRWQQLLADGITMSKLVDFHSRHKYLVMAHNQTAYRRLGKLVANHDKTPVKRIAKAYFEGLMEGLKRRATTKQHTNVLQHMAGYLKKALDKDDKKELQQVIDAYREGLLPLVVPITLLKHYFRKYQDEYISNQVYLQPHPAELMLFNHV